MKTSEVRPALSAVVAVWTLGLTGPLNLDSWSVTVVCASSRAGVCSVVRSMREIVDEVEE